MHSGVLVLYTTFPDQTSAEKVCGTLLNEKLIACANLFAPMKSMYPWKGVLENSKEIPAYLKTQQNFLERVEKRFKELHPYETPCLIQVSGEYCIEDYAKWLRGNTTT